MSGVMIVARAVRWSGIIMLRRPLITGLVVRSWVIARTLVVIAGVRTVMISVIGAVVIVAVRGVILMLLGVLIVLAAVIASTGINCRHTESGDCHCKSDGFDS